VTTLAPHDRSPVRPFVLRRVGLAAAGILTELGAATRTEAVARARSAGLGE
jgi:hypothetical protein